ncbi:HopJ type III effector protein [Amphritea sp. 1_MG-2023]|uniref:HopJ type III effector protein n=1 Tax=Amphritea sp. 1_MG-2023 TaxID=3062670 RepID=UPI0026E2BCCE|nr:HopJ type III effector protein [Amphritea sp. 1_MG-2023]MDO6562210.1 HopJ type III effector protein [Amphritea sp. 1_MG-2023]
MNLQQFIQQLEQPNTIDFEDTMAVIEAHYDYTPSRFTNGELINEAGTNQGSCKIFAFATLNNLSEQHTLNCFGRFYRQDVLQHPEGKDHGNIRNFITQGWAGISFDQAPLVAK